jgi:drug/metabolite transporter (DMT)-like permease
VAGIAIKVKLLAVLALDTQKDWLSGASKDTNEARQPNIHCNLAVDWGLRIGLGVRTAQARCMGTAPDRDLIGDMVAGRNPRMKKSIATINALLLLSFLWALGALRADLLPQFETDRALQQDFALAALSLSVVAISATVIALARGSRWPRGGTAGDCVAAGLGLFVLPAVLIHLASYRTPDFTRVAVFSLVPVFTVVFEPHISPDSAARSNRGLMAALVAVAGTLCIFPIDLPGSLEAGLALCAVVLATACAAAGNCWGVRAAGEAAEQSIAPIVAITSAAGAIGLAVASILLEHHAWSWWILRPDLVWSGAVELPGLVLLFWLMRRMSATRMSTRFLIAPLIANVGGLIVLRARVSIRDVLGLLLIALSSNWLLFAKQDDPEISSSLKS